MANVARVLKNSIALLALVPGAAMLLKVVPVPPPEDTVISALSLALGVATVLAITLLQNVIKRISPIPFAISILVIAAIGASLAIFYAQFAHSYIIEFKDDHHVQQRVVVPMHRSPELDDIYTHMSRDYAYALQNPITKDVTERLIDAESGPTKTILVISLLLAQLLLVSAVVAGAWRAAFMIEDAAAMKKPPAPSP